MPPDTVLQRIAQLGIVPVVAKPEDLAAGNWTGIRNRCRTALETLARAHGPKT